MAYLCRKQFDSGKKMTSFDCLMPSSVAYASPRQGARVLQSASRAKRTMRRSSDAANLVRRMLLGLPCAVTDTNVHVWYSAYVENGECRDEMRKLFFIFYFFFKGHLLREQIHTKFRL